MESSEDFVLKTIGEVQVGDYVPAPDGSLVEVKEVYDAHVPERMFELYGDNGDPLKVSGNHLFYVTTRLDREGFRARKKKTRKILKGLSDKAVSVLEDMSVFESPDGEVLEFDLGTVYNIVSIGFQGDKQDLLRVVERVCASVGHVAEENYIAEDLYDGSKVKEQKVRKYDGRLVARQLLGFMNSRKYPYELLKGKVVDANWIYDNFIPADAKDITLDMR